MLQVLEKKCFQNKSKHIFYKRDNEEAMLFEISSSLECLSLADESEGRIEGRVAIHTCAERRQEFHGIQ